MGWISLLSQLIGCGCVHFLYNEMSMLMLGNVSPLTHSILNVCRRILNIIFAIFFFNTIPLPLNVLGMFLVFAGVLLYFRAEDQYKRSQKRSSSS